MNRNQSKTIHMMIKSNEKINNLDVYFKINYYDSSNYY